MLRSRKVRWLNGSPSTRPRQCVLSVTVMVPPLPLKTACFPGSNVVGLPLELLDETGHRVAPLIARTDRPDLPLIAVFGYTADAVVEGTVKFGLLFTYLGLPLIFGLTAALIIWNFPIDARRHAIIRKRIEQRAERKARAAASA